MTQTSTPQDDLKLRIAAVLDDLKQNGSKDAEAMWVLGSISAQILDQAKAKSWTALHGKLSRADQDKLLVTFRDRGNQFEAEGNRKAAYAAQALGLSVAAHTQTDKVILEGAALLDNAIDRATVFFRQNPPKTN